MRTDRGAEAAMCTLAPARVTHARSLASRELSALHAGIDLRRAPVDLNQIGKDGAQTYRLRIPATIAALLQTLLQTESPRMRAA